ncbi:MAG: hypothetical protein ACI8P9_005202, partial [Parasphingorhabdus sp.]
YTIVVGVISLTQERGVEMFIGILVQYFVPI